ncbi:repressor of RNA polymerase III transcription MAF1 -like protein, partial [Brachionus plicatilis]
MKLLENTQFEALSSALSVETGVCKINSRIESYSCKMAGDCKKLYKQMHDDKLPGSSPNDLQLLGRSGTLQQLGVSPTMIPLMNSMNARSFTDEDFSKSCGNIDIISRKTLFYLISTLNASFQPDYDFSNTLSSEFSREPSLDFVIKSVESYLATSDAYNRLKQQLWDSIDKEINLAECEFYSYNPDLTSDPCSEDGCLWFFNYFIYNKKMKRIVFISCRCNSKSAESSYGEDEEMSEENAQEDSRSPFWSYQFSNKTPANQLNTMI